MAQSSSIREWNNGGNIPIRVTESDKAKLSRGIYDEIFRDATQVGRRQAGPHHELYNKVTVADAPQTILRKGLKSQLLCEEVTVHGEGVSRECARAEGQNGYPRDELAEAVEIRAERKGVGQEEVGPADGLSALERRHRGFDQTFARAQDKGENETWRCVYPGMRWSLSLSARSTMTRMSATRLASISLTCSISQRRISVATWSFLDRPVCNFPPNDPISSLKRRSLAV